MLVSLKPLMEDAMKKGYAVGAFNCPNMESVMAIIQAAEETNSPVILNYAEVHGNLISMEDIAPVMLQFAKKASADWFSAETFVGFCQDFQGISPQGRL